MNATVIYSDRKTVGIQIKRDGSVVVHAPKGMSRARINELLEERAEWIRKHSQERAPRDGRIQQVYYLGKAYPVERGEDKTVFDGGRFILPPDSDNAAAVSALAGFFKAAGKRYMADKTAHWASVMRLPQPPAPRITGAKTRWGSCGGKGGNRINYSYMLMMTDEECIDYVAVHELCHITYKNHNADFYALVRKYIPDYKNREAKLKEYGKTFTKQGFYD
jgi:hypothetical protein